MRRIIQVSQFLGISHRQRPQPDSVYQLKNRRIRPDPQRQGKYGNECKRGIQPKLPNPEPQIRDVSIHISRLLVILRWAETVTLGMFRARMAGSFDSQPRGDSRLPM